MTMEEGSKKVELQLRRTANKIKRSRKNCKFAEKEAAEFKEIHRLLENLEHDLIDEMSISSESKETESSIIPFYRPQSRVFNIDLLFSLYNEESICLSSFIDENERSIFFGIDNQLYSEEILRKFISGHLIGTILPGVSRCTSFHLYVLYLMSVHGDPDFIDACFDFLSHQSFHFQFVDLLPIYINFGMHVKDMDGIDDEKFLKKFGKCGNIDKAGNKRKFPYFNMEMVGKIILSSVAKNLINFNFNEKSMIRAFVRISLDSKVRSGSLLPLYSTLVTTLCKKLAEQFNINDVLEWINFSNEHLLIQIEVCRLISRGIFRDLHEALILKTIRNILASDELSVDPPMKIAHVKAALEELTKKQDSVLEFYSILQLINSSLPDITAVEEDSLEINNSLCFLERKVSHVEDSVDHIRLKLELAKTRILMANLVRSRFPDIHSFLENVDES